MFCGKCGSELQDGAKFCAKCGAAVENSNSEAESQTGRPGSGATSEKIRKKKSNNWLLILGSLVAGLLIAYVMISGSSTPSNDEANEHYISCAKQLVSQQLKSPATAMYSECDVKEIDEYGRILVSMTVDSQNGFGGYLRTYAIVILQEYDFDTDEFTYNTHFSVQFYNNQADMETTIDLAKELNSWGEPRDI